MSASAPPSSTRSSAAEKPWPPAPPAQQAAASALLAQTPQVRQYAAEPLYDPKVLRTLFLDFDTNDWRKELAAFYDSGVDLAARLTVDGRTYPGVGVHFRGMTSYMMVAEGRKKSLNLSLDMDDKSQRLLGYRTLNLLNSAGDPSLLRSVPYLDIARAYGPAPKANFVRLVINGENWGVYVNAQQFNSDFTRDFHGSTEGWRWKRRGGLRYLGDDPEKALLHKLMAVPALKARYLGYVRDVATKWLDWSRLGPLATGYRSLIAEDVKADTRKLATTDEFVRSLDQDARQLSLKSFADKRRAYLLKPAK